MKIFKALTLSLIMLLAIPVCAENGMNSPYTRFGFGQLHGLETGTSKGMGGTGIGVHNSNQINMLNPASYAAVDTLTFLLDIGASLNNTNLAEGGTKMNARNAFKRCGRFYFLEKILFKTAMVAVSPAAIALDAFAIERNFSPSTSATGRSNSSESVSIASARI